MEFLNSPVNNEEQMKQIVKDTDEIIRNFKEISEIIAEKIEYAQDPMLNLGRKLVNYREEENADPESTLGNEQITFI